MDKKQMEKKGPQTPQQVRQAKIAGLLTGELPADPLARRAVQQLRNVTQAIKEGGQTLQQLQRQQELVHATLAKAIGEQEGLVVLLLGEADLSNSETKPAIPDGQTLEDLRKASGADRVEAVSTTGEVLEVAQKEGAK
jgi:hypothetical protein